jgi:hypothetical protein
MEALLELEKVQRVLSFMSSRGLSDSGDGGAAADRFLAQFILFLVRWSSPSVPPSPRLLDLPFPPSQRVPAIQARACLSFCWVSSFRCRVRERLYVWVALIPVK